MSLIVSKTIEITEYKDFWEILERDLDEFSNDEVIVRELGLILGDRRRLEYQCAQLKVIFPDSANFYDQLLNQQIHRLEDRIRKLLPTMDFIS